MPSNKCCVSNCAFHKTPFHTFPIDYEMRNRWCQLISREDLLHKDVKTLRNGFRICDAHFAEEDKFAQVRNRTNLKAGSFPRLNLPGVEIIEIHGLPSPKAVQTALDPVAGPSSLPGTPYISIVPTIDVAPTPVTMTRSARKTVTEVKFTFRGLMAPTLTAFNADLSVNLDVIQDYAKFLAEHKIMGILVNGTSGEGMSMSVAERKSVTEEWVKAVKITNQHLMVQIGGAPLPDVLELAKHAESVGVHSLLCLPDLYFKPTSSSDLIRYLKTVGAAAPNTPLLYYHIPSYTNVNIHMGQFLNDVVGKIPTFHGIKFTSTALDEGIAAVKANGGKYAVFLGADQLMAGAYTLGFDSAIATSLNMFPELGLRILEAVKQSKVDEARELQNTLTEVCSVVTKNGTWVPTMKVAMNLYTPINVGRAREPLLNITEAQINEMKTELKAAGIKN